METQELLSLRNYFYVGANQKVAAESKALSSTSPPLDKRTSQLRDVYFQRSLVAQGRYKEVFASIDKNAPAALQMVRLLATYQTSTDDNKELVFDTLREWLADSSIAADIVVQLLAAQIYFEAKDYRQALKLVIGSDALEMKAMAIQIYLQMDRVDLAASTLKQMTEIDDDDTLTSLASVWVLIAQGGERVKEAFEMLQELQEKFGSTVEILNTMAVCLMHQRSYASAFAYLKSARELAISNQEKVSPTTLVNSIVCLQHMRKPQSIIDRIIGELRQTSPGHPWLQSQAELEAQFNQAVATFSETPAF